MILYTDRLQLEPIGLPLVEAVLRGDRRAAEEAARASFPAQWPGPDLVQRAFPAQLEAIRADPATRLWGDRLMIPRQGPRRVIGSVVFHGKPGAEGVAEVGYGVERELQHQGLATEALRACLEWALAQPGVRAVRATTFALHRASLRVLEKVGMQLVDRLEHELLGELLILELRADAVARRSC
ncbi:MAG: GNAT family protein [Myxococcales bacterium]|nr:GNAT family N-acetyltransferase [Myxococcota bacterium]MDW8284168.1 GNAT family protein [Myxococcales bacterium]